MAKKPLKNSKKTVASPPRDQRTIETTLYEPQLIADKSSVTRIFGAIDAAQTGNTQDLFSLYRDYVLGDSHVQSEFSKRKLAILADKLTISPVDPDDPQDKEAADFLSDIIPSKIRGWTHSCSAILDSTLWPVSVAEKVFSVRDGKFAISKIVPVPHHLEDYTAGRLRIRRTNSAGMPLTDFDEVDPSRYIVHRGNLLNMPDNFGGPMRSILFWTLFRTCNRDWWIRFLDRFGSPFMVGKYDGDEQTRLLLQQAFSSATRLFGIAVSRDVEITLQQANATNADAYKVFHGVANDEISRLIVGQTLSSTASSTGLNSGVADLQADVRNDIKMFDALMLIETIHEQICRQCLDVNGFEGDVELLWGSLSSKQLTTKIDMIKNLFAAGITLTDESLAKLSGQTGLGLTRSSSPSSPGVVPLSAEALLYRSRPRHGRVTN